MSSVKLQKHQPQPDFNEKRTIVNWFSTYCNHEFGLSIWNNFLENKRFTELLNQVQPIYGDAIFKEMADIVCHLQNIAIMKLLKDFSNFINKYY